MLLKYVFYLFFNYIYLYNLYKSRQTVDLLLFLLKRLRTYPIKFVPISSHYSKYRLNAKSLRFLRHAAEKSKLAIKHFRNWATNQTLIYYKNDN